MTEKIIKIKPGDTPDVIRAKVTGAISTFVADLLDRTWSEPDALAVADAWMKGRVVFVIDRSSLEVVLNVPAPAADRPADLEPTVSPADDDMPGLYL